MNDAEFLKFLKTFNKEAKKISLKGNLIVSSYWLFVGLLIANSWFLNPPLYATMLYWIWLIIYQFKIIDPIDILPRLKPWDSPTAHAI